MARFVRAIFVLAQMVPPMSHAGLLTLSRQDAAQL